ncbi:hypothetical protein lerEdw1_002460 [Lerista edwardsae]|nr:hypothetical protein lerEdw1_002460 [Lerista edwardsae]
MKTSWVFSAGLAVFWGAVLGAAFYGLEEQEETVLVDNKCQCAKVTSRFVPSKDNPEEEVLERNIRIICKKCDQTEDNQGVIDGESTMCGDPNVPCYTYDRNRCYTSSCLFSHAGKTELIETALTPDSCYPD